MANLPMSFTAYFQLPSIVGRELQQQELREHRIHGCTLDNVKLTRCIIINSTLNKCTIESCMLLSTKEEEELTARPSNIHDSGIRTCFAFDCEISECVVAGWRLRKSTIDQSTIRACSAFRTDFQDCYIHGSTYLQNARVHGGSIHTCRDIHSSKILNVKCYSVRFIDCCAIETSMITDSVVHESTAINCTYSNTNFTAAFSVLGRLPADIWLQVFEYTLDGTYNRAPALIQALRTYCDKSFYDEALKILFKKCVFRVSSDNVLSRQDMSRSAWQNIHKLKYDINPFTETIRGGLTLPKGISKPKFLTELHIEWTKPITVGDLEYVYEVIGEWAERFKRIEKFTVTFAQIRRHQDPEWTWKIRACLAMLEYSFGVAATQSNPDFNPDIAPLGGAETWRWEGRGKGYPFEWRFCTVANILRIETAAKAEANAAQRMRTETENLSALIRRLGCN